MLGCGCVVEMLVECAQALAKEAGGSDIERANSSVDTGFEFAFEFEFELELELELDRAGSNWIADGAFPLPFPFAHGCVCESALLNECE